MAASRVGGVQPIIADKARHRVRMAIAGRTLRPPSLNLLLVGRFFMALSLKNDCLGRERVVCGYQRMRAW